MQELRSPSGIRRCTNGSTPATMMSPSPIRSVLPPVAGGSLCATLDRAAANYRDGEALGFDNASTGIGSDLAHTVEIESYRARVGEADEITPVSVRVTTVFRLEEAMWKVVHRHADPITAPRPAESVIQT